MRALPILLLCAAVLAGCGGEPPRRELRESQVRVFTDRVLAELRRSPEPGVVALASNPDRTGGMYGDHSYRSAIEADGRAVCSHIIAGVPADQAFHAAYPDAQVTAQSQMIARFAGEVLCPPV